MSKKHKALTLFLFIIAGIQLLSLTLLFPNARNQLLTLGERFLNKQIPQKFNWGIVNFEVHFTVWILALSTYILYLLKGQKSFSNPKMTTIFSLGAVFIISSLLILLRSDINSGHDISFHLMRIEGIAHELKLGHFPARLQSLWLDGYGYPVSIMYGDALLYLPALLRLTGLSLTNAYRFYMLFINVATIIVSYECFKRIFQSSKIGLVTTLAYATAQYRFLNLFVRAAAGECTAFIFFPIIALAIYNIYLLNVGQILNNALLLAFGMSGLIFTHILSVEMATLTLAVVSIILCKKTFTKNTILTLFLAVIFTVLLTAIFLIPFLDYFMNVPMNITQLKSQNIQEGGLSLKQLFMFFQYPYGHDSPTLKERMALSPGLPFLAGLAFAVYLIICGKKDMQLIFLLALSLLFIFTSSNMFPWNKIAPTQFGQILCQIQFSWRWLGIALMFLTLLLGRTIVLAGETPKFKLPIVFCGLVLFQTFVFNSLFILGATSFSPKDYTDLATSATAGQEYIRLGADQNQRPQEINAQNAAISNVSRKGNTFAFHVSTNQEGFCDLPVFNYKGYTASTPDGTKLKITDGYNKVARIILPANFNSKVTFSFQEPIEWRIAEIISLLSFLTALSFIIIRRKKCRHP